MKYSVIKFLLIIFASSVLAAEPPELVKLEREYEARLKIVTKPVRAWYVDELDRLQKTLATRGDLAGALMVKRERDILLVGGAWTWHDLGRTFNDEIIFQAGGIGRHTHFAFHWDSTNPWTFTITAANGQSVVITFNPDYTSYKGIDFNGKTKIEGERK